MGTNELGESAAAHPSSSDAQLAAEPVMIAAVAGAIGVPLAKKRLSLGEALCEVDGVSDDEQVLVEAFAHQGKLKGGQFKKVSEDALKLITLARTREGTRLILAFADEQAAASFSGGGWKAEALRLWNIAIVVVELDGTTLGAISDAQVKQYR